LQRRIRDGSVVASLIVRGLCWIVNLFLGGAGAPVPAAQEQELALTRSRDPYFHAFRARCLQWVYGEDPRRALEQERVAG
jgi:hypothetical protein